MVRGEAISKQFHTKIQCHSFIHSFIHSFLLQTCIASVLYTRQHACKKGGMTQRLPRQASGTHLGEASWSIRMKARGTKLRGWLSRSYKPVWLPEQAGVWECADWSLSEAGTLRRARRVLFQSGLLLIPCVMPSLHPSWAPHLQTWVVKTKWPPNTRTARKSKTCIRGGTHRPTQ